MKIERLSLQAFGPYVKRQDIDFASLSKHHLFLIQGETGAGKTMILDAITYALYGKSSGGERGDLESMRCRFAKLEVPTFVELIFSIHEIRYRFYRELRGHKKRSGEMTWRMRIDGGSYHQDCYVPFFENCKLKLLEEKAEELIGLTHAQFMQVMMLPQGKFEQLLVSKSEEKQEILKTLFQMENWEEICNRLQEKQRLAKQEIEKLQQATTVLLAQARTTSLEELDMLMQTMEEDIKEGRKQQKQHAAQLQQLQVAKEEQVQLHQVKKRYDEQMASQQKLLLQQDKMEARKLEIQRLQQMSQLYPYFQAYTLACKQLKQRKEEVAALAKAQQQLQEQKKELSQQEVHLPKWKEKNRLLEQEILQLTEGVHKFKELTLLQKQKKERIANMQESEKQMRATNMQIEKQQAMLQENEKMLSDCEEILVHYPTWLAKKQCFTSAQTLRSACKQEQLQQSIKEKQLLVISKHMCKAIEDKEQQQQVYEKMYEQYIEHSAALLAELLKEGEPCPVCGSLHHEATSHIQGQQIEVAQLQKQKQQLDALKTKSLELENEKQQLEHQIQQHIQQQHTLQKQILDILPDGYDEKQHSALDIKLKQAEQANIQKEAISKQRKKLVTTLQALEISLKKLQEKQLQLHQEQAYLQARIAEKSHALPSEYSSWEEINDAVSQKQKENLDCLENIQHLEEAIKQFAHEKTMQETALIHAQRELQQAQLQLASSQQEYESRCNGKTYVQDDFRIDQLEAQIQELEEYTTHTVELQASIEELSKQLQDKVLVDIHQLQQQLEKQHMRYQEIVSKQAQMESEFHQLHDVKTSLLKYQASYEEKQKRYLRLSDFVKAMRGDNGIGIERYVLGVMLSRITQAANQLLRKVHQGRYQIYRSDETSGRTRKSGLELHIYDAYSCSYRSVVSLSGGEKFLVSLALSLALSTVVQAQGGGIRMDCMFIDEGFGSLDEQSIDDALQVLMSMSSNKGMIGIISHVEVLKENIPYGIHVYKDQQGSSIQVTL